MFGRLFQSDTDRPFQAVVASPVPPDETVDRPPSDAADAEWSVDEIESAYLRALEAAEAVPELTPVEAETTPDSAVLPEDEATAIATDPSAGKSAEPEQSPFDGPRVTPRQIIEALLFVGGRPLTARQLADVLGGSCSQELVDEDIQDLNAEYLRQQRPYEIRLGEGGYRLDLRPQFEKVRARVFGIGPREVRLPQSALEVLALVAYQQPVTRDQVEDAKIPGAGGLLRQLLRRELIRLERSADGGADVYHTTDRFLELFGLRQLADLPRPESIDRR